MPLKETGDDAIDLSNPRMRTVTLLAIARA